MTPDTKNFKGYFVPMECDHQYIANQTEGIPYWARRLHNVEQMPALRGKNKEKVFVQY